MEKWEYILSGLWILLFVAQILLLVFAAIKKDDKLWAILFGFIVLCVIFALCARYFFFLAYLFSSQFFSIRSQSFSIGAGLAYCAVFLASLITRTALIPRMGFRKIYISLWIAFSSTFVSCIIFMLIRLI